MDTKSLNVIVNDYCNSKCSTCNIWRNRDPNNLTLEQMSKLCNLFPQTEDISFTGGEPFLRRDLNELILLGISLLPNLRMLFINTNGTFPERVKSCLSSLKGPEIYLCVSIDGNRELHNRLRGINSYDQAIQTLKIPGNHRRIISTTLQEENCNYENLEFISKLASDLKSEYTFRFAENAAYYANKDQNLKNADPHWRKAVLEFLKNKKIDNPFLKIQEHFLITGKIPLLYSGGNLRCRAGEVFLTIRPTGDIVPCIYSERVIGNLSEGVKIPRDLGKFEPCPCCTECTIYPMLNYVGEENERNV